MVGASVGSGSGGAIRYRYCGGGILTCNSAGKDDPAAYASAFATSALTGGIRQTSINVPEELGLVLGPKGLLSAKSAIAREHAA